MSPFCREGIIASYSSRSLRTPCPDEPPYPNAPAGLNPEPPSPAWSFIIDVPRPLGRQLQRCIGAMLFE